MILLLIRYHGDWSLQTVAHMGQFRGCCLAVWFDLSGFIFGPFLLASLESLFFIHMMILLWPGDAVGGGAIYLLVVCLTGSLAYGCWVGSLCILLGGWQLGFYLLSCWMICGMYEVTRVLKTFKYRKHVYHLWSFVEWADRRWKRKDMLMWSILSLLVCLSRSVGMGSVWYSVIAFAHWW
ncbi:hypothetical protein AMTRI_Chr05g60320 [Amborella trichopoda]